MLLCGAGQLIDVGQCAADRVHTGALAGGGGKPAALADDVAHVAVERGRQLAQCGQRSRVAVVLFEFFEQIEAHTGFVRQLLTGQCLAAQFSDVVADTPAGVEFVVVHGGSRQRMRCSLRRVPAKFLHKGCKVYPLIRTGRGEDATKNRRRAGQMCWQFGLFVAIAIPAVVVLAACLWKPRD